MDRTNDIYNKLNQTLLELLETHTPMMVAGVLTTTALGIYKTLLSESEFNSMVDIISESRDQIQPFVTKTLQ